MTPPSPSLNIVAVAVAVALALAVAICRMRGCCSEVSRQRGQKLSEAASRMRETNPPRNSGSICTHLNLPLPIVNIITRYKGLPRQAWTHLSWRSMRCMLVFNWLFSRNSLTARVAFIRVTCISSSWKVTVLAEVQGRNPRNGSTVHTRSFHCDIALEGPQCRDHLPTFL